MEGQDRRPDHGGRHLRPHRSRFLHYSHRLQRVNEKAEGRKRRRLRRLRRTGLCPDPEFFAYKVFQGECCCVQIKKRVTRPGITLLAKPHTGAQVALLRSLILQYG